MTWTLALAVTSSGIGAAKIGADDVPENTGYYPPEVERALAFSAEGESTRVPEKTVLVVEVDIPPHQLRWFLGEMVIAGIPTRTVQVRSDTEVLATTYGEPVLLVDADREAMVPPAGAGGEPLHAGRAGEIVGDTGARVVVVGHEEVRGKVLTAFHDLDPVELDRADVARLALENPTTESLLTIPPREEDAVEPADRRNMSVVGFMSVLAVALAVILAISFFF